MQQIHIISITLLSLLLPLSFLLLARLSNAYYLLSLTSIKPPKTLLYYLFLNTNQNLLHVLMLVISLASLIHSLTSKISFLTELPRIYLLPRAWLFLCTFQICVGLGIEATIEAKVNGLVFVNKRSMISNKLVFFMGLHETMTHWSRTIVRPIVNDTVYGGPREETWPEKWAVAMCFSVVSWWRLRDEVELLVVVVEAKRDMSMVIGLGDFIGLLLYYLTIAIGMSRILKGIVWFCVKFFCRTVLDGQEFDHDELEIVVF